MPRIFSSPAGISSCTALTLTLRAYSFFTSTPVAVCRWYEAETLKLTGPTALDLGIDAELVAHAGGFHRIELDVEINDHMLNAQ